MPLDEFDDDATVEIEAEPVDCPMCGGDAGILGVLGRVTHYLCRYCGWHFARD